MEEFDQIIQEAKKDGDQWGAGLSRLLLEMWQHAKKDVHNCISASRKLFIVSIISAIISIICVVFCAYLSTIIHDQSIALSKIEQILDDGIIIEETTTTTHETTTTVTQDTGEGSGNNIYQAGDGSTYTQSGGDE